MLLLFETAAGFALFKVLDEDKISKVDSLTKAFETPEKANKIVSLQKFQRFKNTADALKATTALVDSKLGKSLKKFLTKEIVNKELTDQLAVVDSKLGGIIKEKLGIPVVQESTIFELHRAVRSQVEHLISGLTEGDLNTMSLGLAHSMSRYKLKFSPDKVDTMIVQAISLLDDLDKELNTYAMRVREWYGWHFPEMGKIVPDNILYAKTAKKLGSRSNVATTDLTDFLPEELEEEVKEAAQISMGTEVSEEDLDSIRALCDQVINIHEYREQLFEYLKNRMQAIAPNLTVIVGELVGARLIAHAGSLLALAKAPASTVQILGAEKALFRALKTKKETPKYGLIYHASLVGQAGPKIKGKISRVLAAKAALAIRFDALGESESSEPTLGIQGRAAVEARLQALEGGKPTRLKGARERGTPSKYDNTRTDAHTPRQTTGYNGSADSTVSLEAKEKKSKRKAEAEPEVQETEAVEENGDKKNKKKQKAEDGSARSLEAAEEAPAEENGERKKKKKKKAASDDE